MPSLGSVHTHMYTNSMRSRADRNREAGEEASQLHWSVAIMITAPMTTLGTTLAIFPGEGLRMGEVGAAVGGGCYILGAMHLVHVTLANLPK